MTPEHWQKVKSILEKALELSPALRSDFLEESCKGNIELRREIEALLKFEEAEEGLLDREAASAILENNSQQNLVNQEVGHYKIIGELGTGGMGAVYLAERSDGEFQQKVALKLIKRGMDSDAVLRRFITERQILASLEHPNIAHLIDGGTTNDGLPYFVMEYVEGVSILRYADDHDLDLNERLNLFREVCSAVSFAHQNLVIHRDLKPSNILIANDRKVKLLDFGIAKLLKSDAENQTATQMHVFTPEYASPEQVRGEKLTTSTDIYSLGVILFELLTGIRPYKTESKNIGEIIKAVCETEPVRPSSVSSISKVQIPHSKGRTVANNAQNTKSDEKPTNPKSLRGDLDNIILKALRKEPERRYSSVEQLSDDIFRHQAGLPVSASGDTWSYIATKFIRRNRIAVAISAIAIFALVGGIIGTTWQAIRAERERQRAELRFENLRKLSNSLVNDIERKIRDLPGSLPARQVLLTRATEQFDSLAAESDGNIDLQLELVWAYQNLGAIPDQKLGDRQKIYEKAVALTEKVLAVEPENVKARDRLAMLYLDLIFVSRLRGDVEYTAEYNRRAVQIVEDILREVPNSAEYQDSFWTVYYHYALTLQQLGQAKESIETAQKILPTAEEMYKSGSSDGYDFMKPHLTHLQIGYGLSYVGEYQKAREEFEAALNACRTEAAKRPENNLLQRNEANIRLQLASALELADNAETGLKEAKLALDIREKMATQNPLDLDFKIAVADAELFYGQMLMRQNQLSTVEERFRKSLGIYQKIVESDSDRIQAKILLARAQTALGNTIAEKGNFSEGLNYLSEAAKFYDSIGAATTIDAGLKRHYAENLSFFANATLKSKDSASNTQAGRLYRQSLDLWQDLKQQGTLKESDSSQIEKISSRLADNEKRF